MAMIDEKPGSTVSQVTHRKFVTVYCFSLHFKGYFKLRNGWTSFLNKDTYINFAFSEVECIPEYNDEEYDIFVLTFEKKSLLSFFGVICRGFARNVGNVQKTVVFTVRAKGSSSLTYKYVFVCYKQDCLLFLSLHEVHQLLLDVGGKGWGVGRKLILTSLRKIRGATKCHSKYSLRGKSTQLRSTWLKNTMKYLAHMFRS